MEGKRLIYSIVFYLLVMAVVLLSKPAMMFDEKGEVRSYGVGNSNTVFSLGVMSIVMAILCYYLFAMIDFIFA